MPAVGWLQDRRCHRVAILRDPAGVVHAVLHGSEVRVAPKKKLLTAVLRERLADGPVCYMVAGSAHLGVLPWPLVEPRAHGKHARVSSYRRAKALLLDNAARGIATGSDTAAYAVVSHRCYVVARCLRRRSAGGCLEWHILVSS